MANCTVVITLQTPRVSTDLGRFTKDTTDPRGECRVLTHIFDRMASGVEPGNFDVQTSASAPVRASGTLTCAYASISNNDTVVIGKTTLTCVTGTPSAGQFKKVTDGPTTCANLVALINATAALKYVNATTTTTGVGVVTITAQATGLIGNQVALSSSAAGFVASATYLASGAGGAETVPVNYSRGL